MAQRIKKWQLGYAQKRQSGADGHVNEKEGAVENGMQGCWPRPRPRTCGRYKLDSISQAREKIVPFTIWFRKERVNTEETLGKRKDEICS